MCEAHSKSDDAAGAALNWDAASGADHAFGPNSPAVELVNHLAEFAMAYPALAVTLSILTICMIAVIFAGAGALMWYSVYLSQRLYGWGPHGSNTVPRGDN